jgi:hypothetical protein
MVVLLPRPQAAALARGSMCPCHATSYPTCTGQSPDARSGSPARHVTESPRRPRGAQAHAQAQAQAQVGPSMCRNQDCATATARAMATATAKLEARVPASSPAEPQRPEARPRERPLRGLGWALRLRTSASACLPRLMPPAASWPALLDQPWVLQSWMPSPFVGAPWA